jgi:integrase
MQRNREQKGYIWREGDWWMLRYRDSLVINGQLVRKQFSMRLEPVAESDRRLKRPPVSILKVAAEKLQPVNQSSQHPEKNVTVADFVNGVYFPHIEGRRTPSTIHTSRGYWKRHLEPRFGSLRLRDFKPTDAQRTLDEIARANPTLKQITLSHIKFVVSAIFRLAVNQGFHPGPNPVREVEVPVAPDGEATTAYDLTTVLRVLAVLPEPARSAVAVAAFGGLRRGEIEGLLWEGYSGDELKVTRSVWRGKIGAPKTPKSKAPIPVITPLRRLLDEHRARAGNPSSGIVFETRNKTPLSMNNLLGDQILPALNRCRHCGKVESAHPVEGHPYERNETLPAWRGWHAFRRGLATNLHDLGVDDITIQQILRHSDVSVTRRCYIKPLAKQSVDAMKLLETLIDDTNSAIVQ